MLSKNRIKIISSLGTKKGREKHQLFLAEGNKLIQDLLLSNAKIEEIYGTDDELEQLETVVDSSYLSNITIEESSSKEIAKASLLKSSSDIIATVKISEPELCYNDLKGKLTIALDEIQNPGNLGTIIRIADWFGIGNILCSKECADLYNPKVVQATMGAIARVKLHYIDLPLTLKRAKEMEIPLIGTTLDGDNIYKTELPQEAIIVMGNEGKGVSNEIRALIDKNLLIPSFAQDGAGSESLNVAVATAITCSEFRRG